MIDVAAYPLAWPSGTPRTPAGERQMAKFATPFDKARRELELELSRLGVRYGDYVISSNIPLRLDGLPYAGAARQQYADPGVAVYFDFGTGVKVVACDRWRDIRDNLRAIGKTIEALRGVERWQAVTAEQAFSGMALPASTSMPTWWEMIGVDQRASWPEIEEAYRAGLKRHHPDRGGNIDAFHALQKAMDQARQERGMQRMIGGTHGIS